MAPVQIIRILVLLFCLEGRAHSEILHGGFHRQCFSNIKSSYPLKCLQCDRVVVEEISISSQLSCKPQKNVSQHLKVDMQESGAYH